MTFKHINNVSSGVFWGNNHYYSNFEPHNYWSLVPFMMPLWKHQQYTRITIHIFFKQCKNGITHDIMLQKGRISRCKGVVFDETFQLSLQSFRCSAGQTAATGSAFPAELWRWQLQALYYTSALRLKNTAGPENQPATTPRLQIQEKGTTKYRV